MTRGRVARATSPSHDSSTSSTTDRLFDATSAATCPSGMFDPVLLEATATPHPAAIMAVVVVFPLVPLTRTTSRLRARSVKRLGAIARPTRPPMTVPDPRRLPGMGHPLPQVLQRRSKEAGNLTAVVCCQLSVAS